MSLDIIKIALCDDCVMEMDRVRALLNLYEENANFTFNIQKFTNATDLLAAMAKTEFDVLFLDVLMPGFDGIQTAKEIRRKNNDLKIIFLTSSKEYAIDGYRVNAYDYLLKPIDKAQFFEVLDGLLSTFNKQGACLVLQTAGGISKVLFSKIEYVEIISKMLYFHLSDGSERSVRGSLAEYEVQLLQQNNFCKVHRSYIVNFDFVEEIKQGEIITQTGNAIPIARASYTVVKTQYTEYLFSDAKIDGGL